MGSNIRGISITSVFLEEAELIEKLVDGLVTDGFIGLVVDVGSYEVVTKEQMLSNRDDVVICDEPIPKMDHINVGTIGHVDHRFSVPIDIYPDSAGDVHRQRSRNKSDRKRNRANRWR